MVASIYNDFVVMVEKQGLKEVDIINARGSTEVYADWEHDFGPASVKIYDCTGRIQDVYETEIYKGVRKFAVPPSGLLAIKQSP